MRWSCLAATVLVSAAAVQADTPPKGTTGAAPEQTGKPTTVLAKARTVAEQSDRHVRRSVGSSAKPARRGLRDGGSIRPVRGPDQMPPRIDRLTPAPGMWIVDNIGLDEVRIGFTEEVTIPAGAVSAWTVGGGDVAGFTTSYDAVTSTLTVCFDPSIRDDRLTIVVDYSVTDLAGNELDGEIADPASAVLPSGDGVRGGQAVFRINILQGDANRDGVVDGVDGNIIAASLGRCTDDAGFDPMADLNLDGCVNIGDVAIFRQAEGRTLPATDGVTPIVTEITPNPGDGLLDELDTIRVSFNERVSADRIHERTCFLLDVGGTILIPTFASQSILGDAADYSFVPALPQCGAYTINISNALADLSGELLVTPSTPPVLTGLVPPPAPVLNPHTTMTTASSVTITGSAPGGTTVETVSPAGTFTAPVTNGAFTIDLPLAPDRVSHIFFTALSTCAGVRGPLTVTSVTHDIEPPHLFIDFPTDGAQITTATTDIAGRVGDMLSGFMGLQVQLVVNGDTGNPIDAIVDVGIGNNGTFFAPSVPMGPSASRNWRPRSETWNES